MRSTCTSSPNVSTTYAASVAPLDAAQSRQARAIFFAAASEIWLPSKTLAAPAPPTTNSDGSVAFGVVEVIKRGTGTAFGFGVRCCRTSSSSGGTVPITFSSAPCAQISSLQTGGFGGYPPTPITPINC